MLMFK